MPTQTDSAPITRLQGHGAQPMAAPRLTAIAR